MELRMHFRRFCKIVRVIAGTARGQKLKTKKGNDTRPTSDRVKESLFNIIAKYVPEANVLDLFAGTGSLGIEALSRGARYAVFIDRNPECVSIIKDNLLCTKMDTKALAMAADAEWAIARLSKDGWIFDIILLDPPYCKNFINITLKAISSSGIINRNSIIIAEHSCRDEVYENIGRLKLKERRKYGSTALSFFVLQI